MTWAAPLPWIGYTFFKHYNFVNLENHSCSCDLLKKSQYIKLLRQLASKYTSKCTALCAITGCYLKFLEFSRIKKFPEFSRFSRFSRVVSTQETNKITLLLLLLLLLFFITPQSIFFQVVVAGYFQAR